MNSGGARLGNRDTDFTEGHRFSGASCKPPLQYPLREFENARHRTEEISDLQACSHSKPPKDSEEEALSICVTHWPPEFFRVDSDYRYKTNLC